MAGSGLDPIGDTAEAHIESLNYDGCGVAHVNGKVTFIEDALPGETVKLRYLNRRKNYDSGKLIEVLSPSPDRVAPACAHFGTCGGCSLQRLHPEAQIRAKQQVLAGQLEHIGKVRPESWLAPLTGPAWGYRRRARLGVRLVPGKDGVLVGFRERRKSFLANLTECPVLEPKLASLLPALRGLIAQLSCPHRIPQIEVAAGDNFAGSEIGRASAHPEGGCAKDGAHHDATALVIRHLLPLTDADRALLREFAQQHSLQIYLQGGGPDSIAPLWPEIPTPLYYRLPEYDVTLHFRPTDFIQVNNALNQRLVHQALILLDLKSEDRVLDLFCGLGNFTLPLARHAQRVLGIGADAQLIAGARRNAELNGLGNAEFRQADLYNDAMCEAPWNGFGFNKLLLDPPRNGAIEVIKRLPREGVERVVYVSCYPATLARDASYLVHVLGFRLAAAGVMDMFPHTSHVESMALFTCP
ncbi:MAG: 23S rRNA (uracil(1939)-C(5))-methyltransferase RlmD [Gammaproteobacteria bacterium]|nr:23S rRNA (uracil(1939)-C(5))-methyltransferase RlmD [Gammaproteobacteria bacterium]